MAYSPCINKDGIANIENFLDQIENSDKSVTQELQNEFDQQLNLEEKYKVKNIRKISNIGPNGRRMEVVQYKCIYKGNTIDKNLPDGDGCLQYDNGDIFRGEFDQGIRNRTGTHFNSNKGCSKTTGTWINGFLEGLVKKELGPTGGWIEGPYHIGVPHGFVIEVGPSSWN